MIKIYIDLFFAINYIIDYISLFTVGKVLYLNISKWRYHTACAVGAIYSCISFFLELNIYIHMLVPLVLCIIVAGIGRLRKVILGAVTFFSCESFIGGCVIALRSATKSFVKTRTHLLAALITIVLISSLLYFFFQRAVTTRFKTPIVMATIEHGGTKKHLALLVDSGNMARDATTGRRIIFLCPSAMGGISANISGDYKTHIVTISGNGSVTGFVPDKISFDDKKYNRETYIVAINQSCENLHGIDGIAPLIV